MTIGCYGMLCSRGMCRVRVARLRLGLNLGVIENIVRRQNASADYRVSDCVCIEMKTVNSVLQIRVPNLVL